MNVSTRYTCSGHCQTAPTRAPNTTHNENNHRHRRIRHRVPKRDQQTGPHQRVNEDGRQKRDTNGPTVVFEHLPGRYGFTIGFCRQQPYRFFCFIGFALGFVPGSLDALEEVSDEDDGALDCGHQHQGCRVGRRSKQDGRDDEHQGRRKCIVDGAQPVAPCGHCDVAVRSVATDPEGYDEMMETRDEAEERYLRGMRPNSAATAAFDQQ